MADYLSLAAQIPGLAAAGQTLASQLTLEGSQTGRSASQLATDIGVAHAHLADTFDNLLNSGGFDHLETLGPGGVIDIALQATQTARTTLGAVQGVAGLLKAASSATPADVVAAGNAIIGTVIAAAVSAGAFSAGVGAVVVAGVALAGEAIAALVGSKPPAAILCNMSLSAVPTITVGCAFSFSAQPVAPGSFYWRHFPEPKQATDAGWYAQGPATGIGGGQYLCATAWQPVAGGPRDTWESWTSARTLIDAAFPDYAAIAGQQAPVGRGNVISDFKAAHFTAWKANRAFALNGMKAQPDYAVLLQTVRSWNAAHAPGAGGGLLIAPNTRTLGLNFETSLIDSIVALSGSDPNLVAGKLLLHTGALKAPPSVAQIKKVAVIRLRTSSTAAANEAAHATGAPPAVAVAAVKKVVHLKLSAHPANAPPATAAKAIATVASPAAKNLLAVAHAKLLAKRDFWVAYYANQAAHFPLPPAHPFAATIARDLSRTP